MFQLEAAGELPAAAPATADSPVVTLRGRRPVCTEYRYVEGMTRIELASSVWKTEALPLSYIPGFAGFARGETNIAVQS